MNSDIEDHKLIEHSLEFLRKIIGYRPPVSSGGFQTQVKSDVDDCRAPTAEIKLKAIEIFLNYNINNNILRTINHPLIFNKPIHIIKDN